MTLLATHAPPPVNPVTHDTSGFPPWFTIPKAVARLQQEMPAWCAALRDRICAAFEAIEAEPRGPSSRKPRGPGVSSARPGRAKDHSGAKGGGGVMAMMKGRVFEKVGVHISTVHGEFAPGISRADPGFRYGSALLGLGHFADRPSLEPACADGAHEYPLRRHPRSPGSAAGPISRRYSIAGASRGIATRRPFTGRCARVCEKHAAVGRLPALQGMVRRVFSSSSTATRRAASAASSTIITGPGDPQADFAYPHRDVGEAFLATYPGNPARQYETHPGARRTGYEQQGAAGGGVTWSQ